MARFIQGHILTTYSPSNPNRDEFGNPKSAIFGGVPRKRFSSQSLKRAYRTSDAFGGALDLESKRTNRLGEHLRDSFLGSDAYDDKDICEAAMVVQEIVNNREVKEIVANSLKTDKFLKKFRKAYEKDAEKAANNSEFFSTGEISLYHPFEMAGAEDAMRMILEEGMPTKEEFDADKDAVKRFFEEGVLQRIYEGGNPERVADVALFGRMFTTDPTSNVEAALNISHALSTHRASKESDYFTAVDDLNKGTGSAHMGEQYFSEGLMYLYWAINVDLLRNNLESLSGQAPTDEQVETIVRQFIRATVTENPGGKQTTMASRPMADYVRLEATDNPPCSHHRAFATAIEGENILAQSIQALETSVDDVAVAYGDIYRVDHATMNVPAREGTWGDLVAFLNQQLVE